MTRFALAATSLLALITVPLVASTMPARNSNPSLSNREQQVWSNIPHHAQFADVPHTTRASCHASEPPQELTTPDPELDEVSAAKIEVSFIVGSDGHVHSPLILGSAGPEQDSKVLKTVSRWRFRPATCNGVATDAEAKIAFSAR